MDSTPIPTVAERYKCGIIRELNDGGIDINEAMSMLDVGRTTIRRYRKNIRDAELTKKNAINPHFHFVLMVDGKSICRFNDADKAQQRFYSIPDWCSTELYLYAFGNMIEVFY